MQEGMNPLDSLTSKMAFGEQQTQAPINEQTDNLGAETSTQEPIEESSTANETLEANEVASGTEPQESSNDEGDSQPTNDSNWWEEEDEDSSVSVQAEPKSNDSNVYLTELSKAIGKDFTSFDEVKNEITAVLSQKAELEKKLSESGSTGTYANDDIRVADELARTGGDWKSYLLEQQINFDQVPDLDLVVAYKLKPFFKDNEEAMQQFLSTKSDVEIQMLAYDVRSQLKFEQKAKLDSIRQEAERKRYETDLALRGAIDRTNELYGMKLTGQDKKEIFDDVTTKNFLNSIFYKKDGSINHDKIVEAAFLMKNAKKIVKTAITKAMNQGKAEILNEVSNPNLRGNGQFAQPASSKKNNVDKFYDGLFG